MKSFFRHLVHNPFIFFAGFAALIHSVWTLDVMFAGPELLFASDPFNAGFRKLIALFMAVTIDIGQIQTSIEIRNGQRTRIKYLTFFSFAAATYFLQWIYLIHHVEALTIGTGVSTSWQAVARPLLDLSIWIIPGLLPASTLLYTFSQSGDKTMIKLADGTVVLQDAHPPQQPQKGAAAPERSLSASTKDKQERLGAGSASESVPAQVLPAKAQGGETSTQSGDIHELALTVQSQLNPAQTVFPMGDTWSAICPHCNWRRDGYAKEGSAQQGLRSHKPYCGNPQAWTNAQVQTGMPVTLPVSPATILEE